MPGQIYMENKDGFIDKRRARGTAANNVTTDVNIDDITGLEARLTAINAGYYTATRLDKMTLNDKVYAVRVNDELAGM
jgi:hypothetical protein